MVEISTATDYADLMEKLHIFLTTNGSAYGLTYAGTGNGTLTAYKGGSASVAEIFTITATSATNFTVVGSVSGSLSAATVGTPYTGTKVQFTLTAGGTAFIAGDVFTLSTAPKWVSQRRARGCTVVCSASQTGLSAQDNVIDGKTVNSGGSLGYVSPNTPTLPITMEFDFLEAETIAEYAIMPGSSTFAPKSWTYEYWNGSAWVVLDTQTNVPAWQTMKSFAIASPVSSTKTRLNISAIQTSTFLYIDAVEHRRTVGGFNAGFSQYIWKAPGNSGSDQIYVGAHHLRRVDVDYFDWELNAFDGYNSNVNFYQQPNWHGRVWLPLVNSSIPYWFINDGRRVIVVAKVGSQYEMAYLGYYDPYFTPAQLPYPICIGGTVQLQSAAPSWNNASFRWSDTTFAHRMPTHGDPNTSSWTAYHTPLRLRRNDGVWTGFFSYVSGAASTLTSDANMVWPYGSDFTLLDVNLDGSYALWPCMLLSNTGGTSPNAYGELAGIKAIAGQSLTAESIITMGPIGYLVLPNISRSGHTDWLCVRLD
jgi:hypothetical protein